MTHEPWMDKPEFFLEQMHALYSEFVELNTTYDLGAELNEDMLSDDMETVAVAVIESKTALVEAIAGLHDDDPEQHRRVMDHIEMFVETERKRSESFRMRYHTENSN